VFGFWIIQVKNVTQSGVQRKSLELVAYVSGSIVTEFEGYSELVEYKSKSKIIFHGEGLALVSPGKVRI
jgi:hypothetical protein